MLKVASCFLFMFGVVFVVAALHPATAMHINPKPPMLVAVLMLAAAGVGLWRMKRWGLYIFLLTFTLGALYNLIVFGAANVGNALVGLFVVGAVAALNWKSLS